MEHKQHTNPYLIPLSIIIAGMIIGASVGGSLYFSRVNSVTTQNQPGQGPTPEEVAKMLEKLPPVTKADHILGNPDAPIKIVEYSDLECPFCKNFHNTLTKIMEEYGDSGKVAWVYRHYPIDNLHKKARREAYALECANEQGGNDAFWAFMNEVMAVTPSNDGLDLAELPMIAAKLKLNVSEFNSCLESDKFKEKIDAHMSDAIATGGEGTPWSIIVSGIKNQTRIPIYGAYPYENIKTMLDDLLGGQPNKQQ